MLKFKFMKGILRTPCIRDERYRERSTTVHDSCMLKKVHGWTDDVILGVQMVIDIVYYISPPMYIQPSSTIFQKEPLNKTTYEPPKPVSRLYLLNPLSLHLLIPFIPILRHSKRLLAMKIREIRYHVARLYLLTLPCAPFLP